jgi:malonate transporter and related proteins
MTDVFSIVLPVFGLIAVGYFGALVGLAKPQMIDGLADFLFIFCLPVMLFKMVSDAPPLDTLPFGYWLSYYVGMATIWILSSLIAAYVFKCSSGETVIAGLAAGQANTVVVATPLILKTYGNDAAFPIAMLIAVNLPITMTVASTLLERSKGSGHLSLRPLITALTTHPILLGIFAGLLSKLTGIQPTGVAGSIVDALAAIALPGSLVSLGMATRRYGVLDGIGPAVTVTGLRMLVHPAITYVLAFHVFHLPPIWAGTAVLFASAPAGINVYLFAARYGAGQGLAASAVTLSTAASIFSIFFWIWILR